MNFFEEYLDYVKGGEAPIFAHRWSAIVALGAYLGREYWFKHGHFTVNPNIFAMIMGVPASRKTTAIKIAVNVLRAAGYNRMAAEKTSKEKFLADLGADTISQNAADFDMLLGAPIFSSEKNYNDILIAADEFALFIGVNNEEFITTLGVLWDYEGKFENKIKSGPSTWIDNPTVSILSGNTHTGFARCFPPEIIGQGFFSRLLLVHVEPTGKRITFPPTPTQEETNEIAGILRTIKESTRGPAKLTSGAEKLIDKIYQSRVGVSDFRFESYNSRRLTHLLKLCLVVSASYGTSNITEANIIYANTILSYTEHLMPRALGEFGKAKHSDVSHKIIQIVEAAAPKGIMLRDIWPHVASDLDSLIDLGKLIQNLLAAGKIQNVPGYGFLPMKKLLLEQSSDTVDYSIFTEEEKGMML